MISLENGIIIDGQNDLVVFPIGDSLVLKFTFEEWIHFVSIVGDANLIFESNTTINNYECGSCGSINSTIEYEEPDKEDFH